MGLNPSFINVSQQTDIATEQTYMKAEQKIGQEEVAQQVETANNLLNLYEEISNPLAGKFAQDEKSIKERKITIPKTGGKEESSKTASHKEVQDEAAKFEKRNPELKAQILTLLLDKAKDCRDKEELLKLLNQFYPDPTLADEALDFLLATTKGSLKEIVQQAKDELQTQKGREIQAGKNIRDEVQRYAQLGVGTPTKLRDLYRDITGNPREPAQLFLELSDRFAYKDLRKVMAYIFHALGTDLKSQGPSIPPGLLHTLLREVRNLQGGLGILQFFRGRTRLINYLFEKNGLEVPKNLTFEAISRQFVLLLQERYPSPEKILQMSGKLGISDQLMGKIIVFSQMRDAVREIASNQFYRSTQHREEVHKALLDGLEDLEDELDMLLETEYEEDQPEKAATAPTAPPNEGPPEKATPTPAPSPDTVT